MSDYNSDKDMVHGSHAFMIVGLGASAGGIQALKTFFEHVPEQSGMAYVVILHLSPDHDSKLAEVLQVSTKMIVTQVNKKTVVEPDHVYVISPDKHLMMADGYLSLSQNMEVEDRRAPVDIFFRTLAESHGPDAVCVVLSGTGANGSMGMKRIKERGGAAFVQNPLEAEFNEMPRNSIATDLVDEILPVAEIPARILAYRNGMLNVHLTPESETPEEGQQKALREVFTQLRIRTGHDFTNYKRATLLRRIERRINVRLLPGLPAYAEYLQNNPEECHALLKDLLISVTNFFRDKRNFETLDEEVISRIIKDKTAEDQVRIWVAGCATGEEAYTIAMLCAEKISDVINAPKIQIFATDIDDTAIAQAREGVYTLNDAADVSPERLRRFFTHEGNEYRIRREIREMILFANHNFLKDPPFSNLNLITCRNVMIYLNQVAQERVLQTFQFALKPGGYLFLGSSESVEGSTDLFSLQNRECHIYKSRQVAHRNYPVPETVAPFRFEQATLSAVSKESEKRQLERISFGDLHQRMLEEYAPPSLVVNEEYEIVHLSPRVGKYLQISGGEITQNLLKLVRQEIRMELRSALYRAAQMQAPVELKGVKVALKEGTQSLDITVKPVLRQDDPARGFLLILFKPSEELLHTDQLIISADEPIARHLEEELILLKQELRNSVEQHEFQAEELKASNEELQAMNEELRSSAEELETSKEELQSINEELRTVNQELKVKIDETTLAGNNLQNLINSADIGTIFLDRNFRVRLFTPAAREIFNLLPADYGRPLTDITGRLDYRDLARDTAAVLEKLVAIETEVQGSSGKSYLMRILPYRTAEDRINGVVLTFVEITQLKTAEEKLRHSADRDAYLITLSDALRPLLHSEEIMEVAAGVLGRQLQASRVHYGEVESDGTHVFVQSNYTDGVTSLRGKFLMTDFGPGIITELRHGRTLRIPDGSATKLLDDGGISIYTENQIVAMVAIPLIKDNKLVAVLSVHQNNKREWTDAEMSIIEETAERTWASVSRSTAEVALRESEERFRAIINQATAGIYRTSPDGRLIFANRTFYKMLGYADEELFGRDVEDLVFSADKETYRRQLQHVISASRIFEIELRFVKKDNSFIWINLSVTAIRDREGVFLSTVAVILDITDRKALDQQKEDFIGIASHELKTPVTSIKAYVDVLQEMLEELQQKQPADITRKLNLQVDRLSDLIRGLLDITKISEGLMPLYPSIFDLNELVAEKADTMRHISKLHRIEIQDCDSSIITADRERIGQAITNLISNAINYSPSGGSVVIKCEKSATEICLSIADEGIGIDDNMQQKIFERFFRTVDTGAQKYPGMGLGLYITANIIHRHGGSIRVESAPGKGSTFTFILPLSNETN